MAKTTKNFKRVVAILEENRPSTMTGVSPRDSDMELMIQILQRSMGANLDARQLRILREVNFESVVRCRRKLQEKGLYAPSEAVALKRRLKSYEIQQVAPNETAGGIQRRLAYA